MSFNDRYSRAVRSKNLRSEAEKVGDADTLGAAGLAGKHHPLAMALLRLFVGDNSSARDIVNILAGMAVSKAWHWDKVTLDANEAVDIARKVLAWHRDGVCKACGGHGHMVIPGTTTIGEQACGSCRGTGRVPFDREFSMERIPLARWLLSEVERETAKAGPAAMASLAPRLEL